MGPRPLYDDEELSHWASSRMSLSACRCRNHSADHDIYHLAPGIYRNPDLVDGAASPMRVLGLVFHRFIGGQPPVVI